MFGRKRDDEEYIAPVEEYRDDGEYSGEYDGYSGGDCSDHSHGSTYDVKEYRDNCDSHSHGQTYENYNAEQSDYDSASDVKAQFLQLLEPGENLIWFGKTDKNAKTSEKGTPAVMRRMWHIWIGINIFMAIITVISGQFVGLFGIIPFAAFGLIFRAFSADIKDWSYAITDRRVITLKGEKISYDYFWHIRGVHQFTSRNNRGYISYQRVAPSENGKVVTSTSSGIFGINQPFAVYQLLINTISCGKQGK